MEAYRSVKKIFRHARSPYEYLTNRFLMMRFPYKYAKRYYRKRTGKKLDYNNVKDLNEKLFWLERYWITPLVVQCSDKYLVREYVCDRGCGDILNEIYGVYSSADEIDVDSLPNRFVLKCNHGCGFNIFCKDKSRFDFAKARITLEGWLKTRYGRETAEFHYQYIAPRIIAEKYIQTLDYQLRELQIFCINGEPQFILARNDLGDCSVKGVALSYTLDWRRVALRKEEDFELTFDLPKNMSKMIEYARILASPFPHVRVDFYEVNGILIFGELTFSTSGNVFSNYKDSIIEELGRKLVLPLPYRDNSVSTFGK